jgi:hypothetical protein
VDGDACANAAEADATAVPAELRHSDKDTPTPTFEALVGAKTENDISAHVARILGGGKVEDARTVFEGWSPSFRRGFALLIQKIFSAGWLDGVGPLVDVWDTAMRFVPQTTDRGSLKDVLAAKAAADGTYVENTVRSGAFAFLAKAHHQDWKRAWMETDVPHANLHVGFLADGNADVHMELYNPLFIKGAPFGDIIFVPGAGSANAPLALKHQHLEAGAAGSSRTSANYYHFMRGEGVPLFF